MSVIKKKFINPYDYKRCKFCKVVKKINTENFHRTFKGDDKHLQLSTCRICSNKRRYQYEKDRKNFNYPVICMYKQCKKTFYVTITMKRKNKQKWCSQECYFNDEENANPCFKKGWSWNGKRKGINNPMNKYSIDMIIEIKKRLKNGDRVIDISNDFNINYSTISAIKFNNTWKHISI